jgi:hypothetical protein
LATVGAASSSPQAEQSKEERDIVETEDVPEHANLAVVVVPWRVPEHELDEEAPLEHRLLVAEHLERVLAMVLSEPARPHAAEGDAVQAILQGKPYVGESSSELGVRFAGEKIRSAILMGMPWDYW